LHSLPEGSTREIQEIELQLTLGLCSFTAKGAVPARPAYARAHDIAKKHGNSRQRFEALYGVWQCHMASGGMVAARPFSDQLLRMTQTERDTGLRLQAHHSAWSTLIYAGEPARVREHAKAGRRLYDPEEHRAHRLVYGGHDPGACARYVGALAESILGYPEKAHASIAEALSLAERIAHPFTSATAILIASMVHVNNREPEEALRRLELAEMLAAEQRLSLMAERNLVRGAALVERGAAPEAIVRLQQGLTECRRRGATLLLPFGLAFLSDALARSSEHAASLAAAREGLEVASKTGEHVWDAELHRLAGMALFGSNQIEEGQIALEEALRVARQQQAKSYELRAATNLARLWGERGRRTEARELLAPVYGWFTEGFDTVDLKEAKALLAELG